ncbi:MAG TPA: hypothetical protein VFQ84_00185, partial [Arenimonas sp.]|uniref:hypothetical protein n=1 Tax=Arenimonas sp. TaxID=1872635 RepID=UPI002D801AD4
PPAPALAGSAAPLPAALAPAPPAPSSPLPSVRDFPLVRQDGGKPWPRSPVVAGDRSLQDYLVRHNAMAAGGGVGGFMPYVDVVTQDAGADAPPPEAGRE